MSALDLADPPLSGLEQLRAWMDGGRQPAIGDTLGFKPAGDDSMPGGMHMWRLMCGTSMIKLVTFERTPQGEPAKGAIGKGFGYRYWTISVSNLGDVVAACEAAGHKVAVPATNIRPGVDIAIVEDPDGNWVEFLAAS